MTNKDRKRQDRQMRAVGRRLGTMFTRQYAQRVMACHPDVAGPRDSDGGPVSSGAPLPCPCVGRAVVAVQDRMP